MAVFMMASGYCYRARIESGTSWTKYAKRKVKGLYIPFVACNGIFVLLTNEFLSIGIYSDNPDLLKVAASWPVQQFLTHPLGIVILAKKLASVILFYGVTQLGTATWFLTALFEVLLFNSLVELITSRANGKHRRFVFIFILVWTLILCQCISDNDVTGLNYAIKCFPSCYVSFTLGRVIKEIQWKQLYSWWNGIVAFAILIVFSLTFHFELSAGKIENVLIFVIASLCGWVCLKTISDFIMRTKNISQIFQYIGRHTMPILCLHVISFKVVSLLYIICMKKPILYLAAWHIIFDADECWKLLYAVAGTSIPVILYELIQLIRIKFLCKITYSFER